MARKAQAGNLRGNSASRKPALGTGGSAVPEVGFLRVDSTPEIQAIIATLRAIRRSGITMARQAERALQALGVPFEE